jgi:hypothetical protein
VLVVSLLRDFAYGPKKVLRLIQSPKSREKTILKNRKRSSPLASPNRSLQRSNSETVLGLSFPSPRPEHRKSDPAAMAQWVERALVVEELRQQHPDKHVGVGFQDEADGVR